MKMWIQPHSTLNLLIPAASTVCTYPWSRHERKKELSRFSLWTSTSVWYRERRKWKWEFCCENVRCEIIIISRQEGERKESKKKEISFVYSISISLFSLLHTDCRFPSMLFFHPPTSYSFRFYRFSVRSEAISRTIDFFFLYSLGICEREMWNEKYMYSRFE